MENLPQPAGFLHVLAIKNPAVKSPDFYYRNYYEKILENFWNNEIS